jgi:hypothetical protein
MTKGLPDVLLLSESWEVYYCLKVGKVVIYNLSKIETFSKLVFFYHYAVMPEGEKHWGCQ